MLAALLCLGVALAGAPDVPLAAPTGTSTTWTVVAIGDSTPAGYGLDRELARTTRDDVRARFPARHARARSRLRSAT